MIIFLSAIEFDIEGPIEVKIQESDSSFGNASRRQNRIATLDGLAVLQDRGYSDADRTFNLTAQLNDTEIFSRIRTFLESYALVRISCRIGCFLGAISNLNEEDGSFSFLVVSDG